LTNDKDVGGVGQNAGWAGGDEEGAPLEGRDKEPVRYLDVPEQLWKYTLVWFFWPSLLAGLGVWWGLNSWLRMPDSTAWLFVAGAAVLYVVIGLRGPQLLVVGSRFLGRRSNLGR
jgi:hypothetical protein